MDLTWAANLHLRDIYALSMQPTEADAMDNALRIFWYSLKPFWNGKKGEASGWQDQWEALRADKGKTDRSNDPNKDLYYKETHARMLGLIMELLHEKKLLIREMETFELS